MVGGVGLVRILSLLVLAPRALSFADQDVESEGSLVLLQQHVLLTRGMPVVKDDVNITTENVAVGFVEPATKGPPLLAEPEGTVARSERRVSVLSNTDYTSSRGDGEHHSVFRVHLKELDCKMFWMIFLCMIGATIVVDRGQALLDYLCQDSEPQKLFLERVYAELMMFGVVAIGIFMFTNFYATMSEETHLLFEFVDILCSMGACGLIFIAGCFFLLYSCISRVWALEEASLVGLTDGPFRSPPPAPSCASRLCSASRAQEVASRAKEALVHPGSHTPNTPRSIEYRRVKTAFCRKCDLSADFHFDKYLDRELVKNAVALMTVHWTTWLAFMFLPVVGLWDRVKLETSSMADVTFLTVLQRVIWLTVAGHFLLVIWLYWARGKLDASLDDDHGHHTIEELNTKQPVTAGSISRLSHALQFFALTNAFLIAVYLMSVVYNASFTDDRTFWLVMEGSGLLINTLVMLPLILVRMSFVSAYFVPDSQTIGAVQEEAGRASSDMSQLKKAWRHMGRKVPQDCEKDLEDGGLDEKAFEHFLHDLHLFVSTARQRRLFCLLDVDNSGTVSRKEIMDALSSEGA